METVKLTFFVAVAALVAASSGDYERYTRPCLADLTLISVGR